ncbi:hypothetical protein E2C01_034811 [Portunus trituberculatus]|uniref:Uncharacterized protein n=1 Tax=Portunus trituberculatus TaxID=210409 RepID=A0A5B7F9R5_PORTR|nr:hypothetical protein [Portunus trituberculatus]
MTLQVREAWWRRPDALTGLEAPQDAQKTPSAQRIFHSVPGVSHLDHCVLRHKSVRTHTAPPQHRTQMLLLHYKPD